MWRCCVHFVLSAVYKQSSDTFSDCRECCRCWPQCRWCRVHAGQCRHRARDVWPFRQYVHCVLCSIMWLFIVTFVGGTTAAAPPPFRLGNPALCGSHPLVTPYYCRLGDLLCFVFIVCLLYVWFVCVLYVSLQYFDTVGWVFWPVKTI